ncbi:hypothetical protein [Streptomyces griseocarneus]|uniref:hypothetical protein n=1 Tax=Streptomyces griseocarneus TaxID=51201 RepID=UPI00167D227D|nr:hypothetical protein [Streptomyces griseocarneus]MBZ6475769.1 alpha-glucosidase C-terminal domain-containing protein [Streptomyces griseocarneus]GHG50875.1 hypothetical protein GCM10018779_11370 [Streptomyces griseocarneus]
MTTDPEAPDEEMTAFVERLARLRPELVRLAECLCLAADVERPLLRRVRLRFLPRSSSGLEAELWFSPLVEAAGEHSLRLDPAAATVLRRRLARRPREHVEAVWDCTREAHAGAPAVTRWFEDLLWADVFPDAAPAGQVDRQLRRVLTAVGTAGEAADELGRWALHYVSRLPPRLLRHEDARRIQVVSCERLGLEPPPDPFPRPAATDEEARALVRHAVPVGVSARSDGLVLSRPPAPGARTVLASGGRKVRLEVVSGHARVPEPVRLEVWEDQSLRLRFAVVERLGPDGRRVMTFAHPGTAAEVAVTVSPGAGAVHCAVLLSEGTIVLHGPDGAPAGRVPAEADASRGSLALSPGGSLLAWIEDGTVRQRDLTTGRDVPVEQTGRAAVGCRYPAEGGELVLTYEQANDPDPDPAVWATDRGEIWARTEAGDDEVPGPLAQLFVGRAPWQVTSLALSPDGRAVAAVGGDTRLLHWAIPPARERVPREIRLGFCADRVFAHPDGGWTVAGSGGPVTLTTEDGDRYFVTPDTEGLAAAGDLASWARGCVVAVARWSGDDDSGESGPRHPADRLEEAREHGVDCLAVGPFLLTGDGHGPPGAPGVVPPPDREGILDLAPLLTRAHSHGLRILTDIDLTAVASGPGDPPAAGVLDFVRRWLDHGLDGVRVLGRRVPPGLLTDLRHLVDGYDERVLMRVEDTLEFMSVAALSSSAERSCHVVASPAFTHPFLLWTNEFNMSAPDTLRPTDALSLLKAAGPDVRWGYPVPTHGLSEELRRFMAAVLLSLPGCPMLPLDVLWEAPVAGMLSVRRDHLALTHGSARFLDPETSSVPGLVREHGDERVLCLVNGTARSETTWVRAADLGKGPGQLLDLLDGSLTECPADSLVPLTVEACSVRWLQWLPPDRPGPLAPPTAGTPRARASDARE